MNRKGSVKEYDGVSMDAFKNSSKAPLELSQIAMSDSEHSEHASGLEMPQMDQYLMVSTDFPKFILDAFSLQNEAEIDYYGTKGDLYVMRKTKGMPGVQPEEKEKKESPSDAYQMQIYLNETANPANIDHMYG